MSCPGADEIVAYLDARLSASRRDEIALHAADCVSCRVALSELARAQSPPTATDERGASLPARVRPGDSIGRYRVVERIGGGAMGSVYLTDDPQLERRVAVKLLHQPMLAGGGARLLVEAQTLARISDPRVVTVFDAGAHHERPFVVMEHVRGMTLSRWLATPRPWRQVLAAFIEAGYGLAAAHAAGVAHGDFKPDNVLVGDDGRVHVTDFGLARFMAGEASAASTASDGKEAISSVGGTPAYMAPEQFAGQRGDALSDQFGFCVALYEGLFGARPFAGRSISELAANLRRPPTPSAKKLPRWLLRLVLRGLSAERTARFPSLRALLSELERRLRLPRRLALSALAVVLMTGVGIMIRNQVPQADRTCRIEARRLGRVSDFQLPVAVAAATSAALDGALRDYLADWVRVRVGACEDAKATDAAVKARFAARLGCLDDGRAQVLSLVQAVSSPAEVPRAAARLAGLPRPVACLAK